MKIKVLISLVLSQLMTGTYAQKLDMRIKENKRWMARCLMVFAVMAFCIGCSKDNDNTAEQPTPPIEQPEKTAAEVLANIPGVTIIKNTKDAKKLDITTFYFD